MYTIINRQPRNPEKFDVLDLFDAIGRDREYALDDKKDEAAFVDLVANALAASKTPTTIYGLRTEAMFAYMAASMGKCSVVKKEDCSNVFIDDSEIKIPDYRIVLNDISKAQMLVEVKNYCQEKAFASYIMNLDYLDGLSRYAELMKTVLYIAIYWSKWCMWTLVSPADFERKEGKAIISLDTAIKRNQMSLLGDVMIGTTPPLAIRIYPDKHHPENNASAITIERVEVLCKNTPITIESERRIAFALIMFGQWNEDQTIITAPNSENAMEFIEFSYMPDEYDDKQGFYVIDSLSTIISRQYGQLTAPDGKVKCLSPNIAPGMLGFIVPEDYKGEALPLWRFHLKTDCGPLV